MNSVARPGLHCCVADMSDMTKFLIFYCVASLLIFGHTFYKHFQNGCLQVLRLKYRHNYCPMLSPIIVINAPLFPFERKDNSSFCAQNRQAVFPSCLDGDEASENVYWVLSVSDKKQLTEQVRLPPALMQLSQSNPCTECSYTAKSSFLLQLHHASFRFRARIITF